MAEFELEDSPEFVAIPEGEVLEAEIVSAEVKESPFWKDQNDHSKGKQQQVGFKFRIVESGEYEDRVIFGNTPTTFTSHPDCKLRVWVLEILGEDEFPLGFRFNTDNLVGMFVKVVVGNYDKKNADGTTSKRDRVDTLIRLSGGAEFEEFSEPETF
jgi:hypothetical protein